MGKPGEALRGIVIGVVYALAFLTLKETPSHLNLSVGLRLAALLITDVRRWPTIFAADLLVNYGSAIDAFRTHDFVTPRYVLLYSILQPLVIFPGALLAHQYKLSVITPTLRNGVVLIAALLVTAVAQPLVSLTIWSTYSTTISAQGESFIGLMAKYFCGTFLGGITMVPIIAFGKFAYDVGGPLMRRVFQSELLPSLKAAFIAAGPCVLLVVVAHSGLPPSLLWTLRIGLSAFPPIVLAALYGTRGAALGLVLANCSVVLTEASIREPGVVEAQQIAIAFSVFAWFAGIYVTGSRERMHLEVAEKDRLRQALSRRRHLPQALRRYKAAVLDEVYDSLAVSRMVERDRTVAREEALTQHFRMLHGARSNLRNKREALFPPLLEEYGLRTALMCAPIFENIRALGETVSLHMPNSVAGVALGTQQTVYQIIHECLTHAMREGTVRSVSVKIRVGSSRGRRWLGLKMKICARPVDDDQSKVRAVDEVTMEGLYDLAEAYGGELRQSRDGFWRQVSALIFDEEAEALLAADTRRA